MTDMNKKIEERRKGLYKRFKAKIRFTGKTYGTAPADPEVYTAWLKTISEELTIDDPENKTTPNPDMEAKEKASWNTFRLDEEGIYMPGYMIKGMLKNVANQLKLTRTVKGLKEAIKVGMFVLPEKLRAVKDGKVIMAIPKDQHEEICGVVSSPQGKRSILSRFDYLAGGEEIEFEIHVLKGAVITEDHLFETLLAGERVGLGACRDMDKGNYELLEFEAIE